MLISQKHMTHDQAQMLLTLAMLQLGKGLDNRGHDADVIVHEATWMVTGPYRSGLQWQRTFDRTWKHMHAVLRAMNLHGAVKAGSKNFWGFTTWKLS